MTSLVLNDWAQIANESSLGIHVPKYIFWCCVPGSMAYANSVQDQTPGAVYFGLTLCATPQSTLWNKCVKHKILGRTSLGVKCLKFQDIYHNKYVYINEMTISEMESLARAEMGLNQLCLSQYLGLIWYLIDQGPVVQS